MPTFALRRRVAATACLAVLGACAPAAHASTWTQQPSGTASDITAVEYQGTDRLWYTTPSQIIRRVGGTPSVVKTVPAAQFSDIEFQPAPGTIGLAVGEAGTVYRSTDSGATWTAVALPNAGSATASNTCGAPLSAPSGIDSVRLDGAGNWWLLGQGSQVWKSTTGGASFVNANTGVPCKLTKDIDDAFFVPGSGAGYFVSRDFGAVFYTSDGLAGAGAERSADAGNGFTLRRRVAGDPDNPARQWAVTPESGNPSYFSRTETGWNSAVPWDVPSFVTRSRTATGDVDYAGGTVVAVGAAGNIMQSVDGRTFTIDATGGATDTTDWLSVSLAGGNDAAIGGRGGVLVISADAAAVPVAPVAATPGPTTPTTAPPTTTTTPPKATLPTPTLSSPSKPPLAGKVAQVRGRYVVFKVRGRLGLPAGLSRKAACNGRMSVSVYKGKKRLKRKVVTVGPRCGYKTTVRVKRSKVGRRTKRLKLKVAFRGNAVLGRLSSTYRVRVKR